ncbi:MAG: tripartite tricarboxylate transporter substrate binding protein [Betaproteobacteria bacterium]|nr:tripartite tricarboxylate transporter substrate binding protein [Betaproteobacteria bacterium]
MPTPRALWSRRLSLLALLGLALTPAIGLAQEWPSKPVTLVVPFPPGGSNDVVARVVGESVRKRIGQTVVVDNKPGANGALGVDAVLRAPKDHHTFLVASDSVSLLPLFRTMSWDLTKSFTPVAVLSYQPIVVVTAASTGLKSIKDLQAAARAKPDQVPYASSGQGSIQHLVGELFSQNLGINLLHIPYKGGGQAVTDVIAGQVTAAVLGAAAVLPHIKSGKLVALAVSTRQRSPMLPDTPTLAESGAGDIDVPQWSALFAVTGTPAPVLAQLRRSVEESLAEPAVKQHLLNLAMDHVATPPDAFQQRMLQDRERWAKLVKDRKISLD